VRFITIRKPSEALPSQVFQVVAKVIKGQRAGKGHISTRGTVPSDRGLARTLTPDVYFVSAYATMAANGIEACDKHIPTGPIRLVQRLKSSPDI